MAGDAIPKRLVIAAGGTGGHMFPAQALAERMVEKGWSVELFTDARGQARASEFPEEVTVLRIASATFRQGLTPRKIWAGLKIIHGGVKSVWRIQRGGPGVVIGFGGYPALPPLLAAWKLDFPFLVHEQNSVFGIINGFFSDKADMVACGLPPASRLVGCMWEVTGNPVRKSVLEHAGEKYTPPGEGPIRILVTGGSQGASLISDVVPKAVAALPESMRGRLSIAHQARPEDVEMVRDFYGSIQVSAEVEPFFGDIGRRMAGAHLVISRAGASTLSELLVTGRPAILIPYLLAAGGHQESNARVMADLGGALIASEEGLDPGELSSMIHGLLRDRRRLAKMAAASLAGAKPDAAERVARLVESVAEEAYGEDDDDWEEDE